MKQEVVYHGLVVSPVTVGKRAWVYCEKHPVLGSTHGVVHTSDVVSVGENGEFETLNSHYVQRPANSTEEIDCG